MHQSVKYVNLRNGSFYSEKGELKAVRSVKRGQIEIIAEILRATKNGAKKTRIMYECSLTYPMTKEFLVYLVKTDFLRLGNSYHTTEKGLQFLKAYQTLELLLNARD